MLRFYDFRVSLGLNKIHQGYFLEGIYNQGFYQVGWGREGWELMPIKNIYKGIFKGWFSILISLVIISKKVILFEIKKLIFHLYFFVLCRLQVAYNFQVKDISII